MIEQLPAAMPPPPREVRRKLGTGCVVGCFRVVIVPPVLVCVALILFMGARVYVIWRGNPTIATVDSFDERSQAGRRYFDVKSHYSLNGRRFTSSDRWPDVAPNPRVGDQFPGRAASALGLALFIPTSESNRYGALPSAAVAIGLVGFVCFLCYWAWVRPIRERWIVMFGETAPGMVTSWKKTTPKATNYIVTYTFTTPDGTVRSGKCWSSFPDKRSKAEPITVLYNPRRPSQNLAYEASDFIVTGVLAR
jgi:hypothetical protein